MALVWTNIESLWNDTYATWAYGDPAWYAMWLCIAHSVWSLPYHCFLTSQLYFKWPFFEKYKIQKSVDPPPHLVREVILNQLFNHLIYTPLVAWLLFHHLCALGQVAPAGPFPSIPRFIGEIAAMCVAAELIQYWVHRGLHSHPLIYKWIHAKHHRFIVPISWAAEFANPLELLFSGDIPAFTGALFLHSHLFTLFVWIFLRESITIDVHSGYAFPWSLWVRLGHIFVGPEGHDWHHSHNRGNYGSIMWFMDRLFGTDAEYLKWLDERKKRENGELAEKEIRAN